MLQQILQAIAQALYFAIPAYATNAFPPVLHGKRPLDRGKMWRGERILGDGKTIEGTIGGIIFGIAVGFFQIFVRGFVPGDIAAWYSLFDMTPVLVILISVGVMFGDIFGSFIKRRLRLVSGASAPGLDQLGFIIMALLFAAPIYVPSLPAIAVLLVLTPFLHWFTNQLGYITKLKKVPW